MERRAFHDHFGIDAPDVADSARIAALRFIAPDLSAVSAALTRGKVAFAAHMGRIVVPPETAMGAAIVFEAA